MPGITELLIREFTKWVVVANIIAWPIAYYAMNNWLQNFAYRTSLNVLIFIVASNQSIHRFTDLSPAPEFDSGAE